ncbi:response regulator [Rhodococcoides trifolii]|uniref:Response regulator n=1 Tax=Rhodococcoides trifolii TaxID=908250 RepID=A0A917LH28_9NOCA|nr:response regulator transcription factor [Rhodococcus trifolii]GGG22849.1 response regulator [Rhodococcus trifolii]
MNPPISRVVIVDDSPAFCTAARSMFEAAGIDVVGTASTSDDALAAVTVGKPDVILVDIDLGGENGFEVVEALAGLDLHPRPAIVLVSTHDEDDFVDMVEASAAVGFVPKFAMSVELIARTMAR